MGKQGPCRHCGVSSTPLWRNGPPEKPVLCNACGSRYRTKGHLENYIPMQARADSVNPEGCKNFESKTKRIVKNFEAGKEANSPTKQNFRKILEDEASNRSSSHSAVLNSESCAYTRNLNGSEMTGSAQSVQCDTLEPSRKKTSSRFSSSVENLAKDLRNILQQQQLSSHFLSPFEEELLDSGNPLDTFEIGLGGRLIKFIQPKVEPVKSSVSVYDKSLANETQRESQNLANPKPENAQFVGNEKLEKRNFLSGQDSMQRDILPEEQISVLSSDSPLAAVDLRVIVNYEELLRHLSREEQQRLMKYLPSSDMKYLPYSDVLDLPGSLQNVFGRLQFLDALTTFQVLLREGMFDLPDMGIDNEERKSLLKLILSRNSKSKWLEEYRHMKDAKKMITDHSG